MKSQLLKKGIEAYKRGNRQLARELLKEYTQIEPENERAWMWLAASIDRVKEKRECLEKALALNPNNKSAQKALNQYVLNPQSTRGKISSSGIAKTVTETHKKRFVETVNAKSVGNNNESITQSKQGLLGHSEQKKIKSNIFQFRFTYGNVGLIYLIGFILLSLLLFQLKNSTNIPLFPLSSISPSLQNNPVRTPFQPNTATNSQISPPDAAPMTSSGAAPPSLLNPIPANSTSGAPTNPSTSAPKNPSTSTQTNPQTTAATKPPTSAPTNPPTVAPTILPTAVTQTIHLVADTYYVSPSGDDANPGTQTQPWKTIGRAASTVIAGDTVIVGAGTYNENVVLSKSGTDKTPITFQGLSVPNIKQSTPTNTACLDTANSCILGVVTISGSQIVFRNMEVAGPPVKPGAIPGITVKGSNDEVSNNFIHNSWQEGIAIRSSTSHNRVLNNNIMYAVVSGIYFDGQNHLIQGNTITHSVTRPPDGITLSGFTDPDGIRFFGSGSVVRRNTIKDIYLDESPLADAPHLDCFQSWGSAVNISFEQNYCELEDSSKSSTPMAKFFMIERQSTTNIDSIKIVNNIFISKSTAILWTPINLGNNSCSNSYPLQNITIENNTFVHPGNVPANFAILMRCTNTATIRNNAFYNFGDSSYSYIYQDQNNNSNVEISNNSVFNSNGISPKDGAYPGDNLASIWMKNPLFADVEGGNFHLQSASPLIDAGIFLGDSISTDFVGNARPQGAGYDIGAYEFPTP